MCNTADDIHVAASNNVYHELTGIRLYNKVNSYRHCINNLLTDSSKSNYERMTGQPIILLTIHDSLTVTVDRLKCTKLWHYESSQPITSQLNWETTNGIMTWFTNQINNRSLIPSTDVIQLTLTLKMTTAQVVETSLTCQQQFYSGLCSPRQSCSTYLWKKDRQYSIVNCCFFFQHEMSDLLMVAKLPENALII